MRQRPGPEELERLAASVLEDHPLPEDPRARSYEQRLAAKALSVAEHDREHAGADRAEELRLFAALWGADMVDEALVYQITRSLWHHGTATLLQAGHPQARAIRRETALDGVAIQLHPGAERYYREAGMIP